MLRPGERRLGLPDTGADSRRIHARAVKLVLCTREHAWSAPLRTHPFRFRDLDPHDGDAFRIDPGHPALVNNLCPKVECRCPDEARESRGHTLMPRHRSILERREVKEGGAAGFLTEEGFRIKPGHECPWVRRLGRTIRMRGKIPPPVGRGGLPPGRNLPWRISRIAACNGVDRFREFPGTDVPKPFGLEGFRVGQVGATARRRRKIPAEPQEVIALHPAPDDPHGFRQIT